MNIPEQINQILLRITIWMGQPEARRLAGVVACYHGRFGNLTPGEIYFGHTRP